MGRLYCVHMTPADETCEECEKEWSESPPTKRESKRRAKWIRENVIHVYRMGLGGSRAERLSAIEDAELMADELEKRGYL